MGYRVYVAEDDPDDIYLLNMAFRESGYDVSLRCFEHGSMLLKSVSRASQDPLPHLIMLDLNLPVFDGKHTLRSLKSHNRLKSIPVVVYTTSKSERDIEEVYAMGANSYMVKSPDYKELVSKIKTLCEYWFGAVQPPLPQLQS